MDQDLAVDICLEDRTCLFIDGASLYSASRSLGFEVDYASLLAFFRSRSKLVRAYYYSAMLNTEEYSPLKLLTDWLVYNGYSLVTKAAFEVTDPTARRRIKACMNIELAVDMLEMSPRMDHAILFSGDASLRRAVEAVQRQGTRVTVVSSLRGNVSLLGDELRRQADQFIELAEIAPEIARLQTEPRNPSSSRMSHSVRTTELIPIL